MRGPTATPGKPGCALGLFARLARWALPRLDPPQRGACRPPFDPSRERGAYMSEGVKEPKAKRSGSETRQRTKSVRVRLTADELVEVETDADRSGLAVGSYVRAKVLTGPAPRAVRTPPVDRQALAQVLALLGRVGSNVNQISRTLNFGERHDAAALEKSLRELSEMRATLMTALGREGAA